MLSTYQSLRESPKGRRDLLRVGPGQNCEEGGVVHSLLSHALISCRQEQPWERGGGWGGGLAGVIEGGTEAGTQIQVARAGQG